MTKSIKDQDGQQYEQRVKFATLLLAIGCLFILTSLVVYRERADSMDRRPRPRVVQVPASQRSQPVEPAADPGTLSATGRAKELLVSWLFYTGLMLLVFVAAASAFRRWSRSFRAILRRPPIESTSTPDVWKMHQLPPEKEQVDDEM